MSILDEIARRRRASALRRLGPPPGALPEQFPVPAQRQVPAPRPVPAVSRAPMTFAPVVATPQHTLQDVLPRALASISSLPVERPRQRELLPLPPPSDPVPLLAPEPEPEPEIDVDVEAEIEIDDVEEVWEFRAEDDLGAESEAAADPQLPPAPESELPDEPVPVLPDEPEPAPGHWANVADAWVEVAPDLPGAPEPERKPEPEPIVEPEPITGVFQVLPDTPAPINVAQAEREQPRYGAWIPAPVPAPDLFTLTTEPVTSTDLKPLTSVELVPFTEPDTHRGLKLPGFVERTQLRRRIRYLRGLREIQFRDLGGFAVELHRFGRDRPELVREKVESAAETDRELRQLEFALKGRVELREVREAGIGGACEHCGAVYGSEDRFCTNCGEPLPGTARFIDRRPPR